MSYVEGDRIYRKTVRFLACREKSNAPVALRLWKKFHGMIDVGSDYDEEASQFIDTLSNVICDLDPDTDLAFGLTRSELRQRDLAVADAAKAFIAALDSHASREFHWGRWCRPLARRGNGTSSPRTVLLGLEDLQQYARDLALAAPPTPRQVALRIERRARELAATRMGHKKSREYETKKTLLRRRLERRLIETLHTRYPSATANRIADIVAPIVEHLFDAPESFDRCRNFARELIKADTKGGG